MMAKRSDTQDLNEAELERLFQSSEQEAPLPSADLFARIMADAEAVQAPIRVAAVATAPGPGMLARIAATLGGWSGVSGLAGVAALGLFIGVFPPELLTGYAETLLGTGVSSFGDYVPDLAGVSADG